MRVILLAALFGFFATCCFADDTSSPGDTFKTPSGKSIRVTVEQPKVDPEDVCILDDRATAKTSFPLGIKPAKEQTLNEFMAELLKKTPDSSMRKKYKFREENAKRVKEENKIVMVDAYVVAAKKEMSNDFILILTTDPTKGKAQYFTSVISGIPRYTDFEDDLLIPRNKFKEYFKARLPGKKYEIYDPPLHVKVTGALLFAADRPAGAEGPKGCMPATAWEIHPIIDIEFLD